MSEETLKFRKEQDNGVIVHRLLVDNRSVLAVAASHGAKLMDLKFEVARHWIPVLWDMTTQDAKSGSWSKSEILFPFPNRLRDGKYVFEKKIYQFPIDEPINMNAIHGFVKNMPFEVVREHISDGKAEISLLLEYKGQYRYYPFPCNLSVTFTYDTSENSLNTTFQIENTGEGNLPFGLGWHPYFSFNHALIHKMKMTIPDVDIVEVNERQLPTGLKNPYQITELDFGKVYMDTAFHIMDTPHIYSLQDDKIRLKFKASSEFDFIQVFNPKHDEAVAIEPMSANMDCLNNGDGLTILKPDEKWEASFKIEFSIIDD